MAKLVVCCAHPIGRITHRWERGAAFDQPTSDGIALTLWRISTAWGAVLDGDVDSLAEHVRKEELASQ